ncbi:MAG: alpha/beta hydrolase [Thermoguttaceae bacterium]|nr:alpha/beta hydrolase [Thermoguttaceae bacterium]
MTTQDAELRSVSPVRGKSRKLRWICLFLWTVAAMVATVSGCSAYAAFKIKQALDNSGYFEDWTEETDGVSVENIPYGEEDWNKIDLYFPKELAPEKSRAAFMYVHGGAWAGGKRSDMKGFARRMTKAGYVSGTIGYTLYKEQTASDYTIFKVLDEIDAALAKLKETASERGIELDRVALGGDSAGGHIISLYAYARGKKAPLPVVFIAPRVAPIDFHAKTWNPVLPPESVATVAALMNKVSADELSAKDVENPDERAEKLIAAVSPLSYLTAENTIPTVSAYGGKDPLVGTGHCAALREKFKELGAKEFDESDPSDASTPVFDCLEYPHSGHMLESDPDYARRFHELVLKYAQRYLDEPVAKESAAQ